MALLYSLLKIPARLALPFYCRQYRVNRNELLQSKGPLLLAANHPNSFLDAILLATLFDQPIYSLARGDAFANGIFTRLLNALNILPVYRISEGAHNLNTNYDTFSACQAIFKKGGIVLIFSEGLCVNEWKLRPLKKGTARLAISCWKAGIPLRVLPTGINYHSFREYGKSVDIRFGQPLSNTALDLNCSEGNTIRQFNELLHKELLTLVDHLDHEREAFVKHPVNQPMSSVLRRLLWLPACAGKWMHAPLYYPIRAIATKKAAPFGHYDSVLIGTLMLAYPLYLFLLTLGVYLVTDQPWTLLILLVFPALARSHVYWKYESK
ncbi:MAG: 1-acyl-sn-glycerol-3-phosphate acyltransferase [Ferruginibacter sp.]